MSPRGVGVCGVNTSQTHPSHSKPYKNAFKSSWRVSVSVVEWNPGWAHLYMRGRPGCVVHRDSVSLQSWATTATSLYDTAVYIWIPSSQLNACDNNDTHCSQ